MHCDPPVCYNQRVMELSAVPPTMRSTQPTHPEHTLT